jgi:hypothetical protein
MGYIFSPKSAKKRKKHWKKRRSADTLLESVFSGGISNGKTASKKYSIFRRKFQYETHGGCEKNEKYLRQKGPS